MDESELPEEARKLPTLSLGNGGIDRKDLYSLAYEHSCKRCNGSGQDPDGDYLCLLCKGSKGGGPSNKRLRFCVKHPGQKLVNIAKRHITWELWGFDHEGFLAVQGCPICKLPAYSIK